MRWSSKPPAGTLIDTSSPFANGLVLALPFNEGNTGPIYNTASGESAAQANVTWGSSEYGAAPSFPANLSAMTLPANPAYRPAQCTILARARKPSTSTGVIARQDDAGSNRAFAFQLTGSKLTSSAAVGGVWATTATGATTLSTGAWYGLGYTLSQAGGNTTLNVYVNGILDGTATAAGSPYIGSATPTAIGNTPTNYVQWGELIDYVFMWNRVLSAGEIAAFQRDPWQIYSVPEYWLFRQSQAAGWGPRIGSYLVPECDSTIGGPSLIRG